MLIEDAKNPYYTTYQVLLDKSTLMFDIKRRLYIMAENNENKVEEQVTPETETKATETKEAKKGVDVGELANKGKDGLDKGIKAVSDLYSKDAKKGLLVGQVVPVLMFLLALIFGKGALGVILMLLVAAANFVGLEAIKKGLPDNTPKE